MSDPRPEPIPFNRVSVRGREMDYIADVLASGQIAGDGKYTRRCEAVLGERLGAERVLLTTSCTHALEMAALLLGVEAGDEVILPSFTFVSTANAFVLRGARPVFVDTRPDTLNLDHDAIEDAVTERTRCIVPVHYGGVGCEMDRIGQIAGRHGLAVVEDNAHGLYGRLRGRRLGTFGALATQSFHATKNLTCGEGGALVVNDPELIERAEILREKGTNRAKFFRGEVDRYTWVDRGSSYVASEILAAFLLGQLEDLDTVQEVRSRIWDRYHEALRDWADAHDVRRPFVPAHCEQAYHLYYLLMPTPEARGGLIDHLRGRGILAVFHYVPLHSSPMGRRFHAAERALPVTDSISERLVRLPFFADLQASQQERVLEAVREFTP